MTTFAARITPNDAPSLLPSFSKSNDELSAEITLLAGQINAANYQFLKLIAEFDNRDAWAGGGVKNCAHWLNWTCGIALSAAREKIRVAHCLEQLPLINNAFSLGEISYSKVRAMTRVATNETEEFLLMLAKHGTASHMEKTVRKYQQVKKSDTYSHKSSDQFDEFTERTMLSYQDDDGMWVIHAKLPAESGALIVKAIEAILQESTDTNEQNSQTEENETEDNNTLSSDSDTDTNKAPLSMTNNSNEENLNHSAITENSVSAETEFETPLKLTFGQKRADALVMMAEHYLAAATNDEGIMSLAGNERTQVMLHVDIHTLMEHQANKDCCHSPLSGLKPHKPQTCHLDNDHWISPETARRLSCDASLVTVLTDDKDNVLNIGRRSRTIPPAIQRALSIRDTTCRHPSCCATRYLDAHHIQHWADGGETKLNNLVMLCRHHHRQLHQGVFSIEVSFEDTRHNLLFRNEASRVIQRALYPQFPKTPSASENNCKLIEVQFPKINSETAVSKWQGEKIDYSMVIEGLFAAQKI